MSTDDNRDIDAEGPLSLEDALLLATRLHRLRQLEEARAIYHAVLEAAPEHPDALQFLGILEHQSNNDELAFEYMQRALNKLPNAPGMHQNLGNILLELRRYAEAADAYDRCAALGGKTAELLNNIGIMRRQQGQYEAAEAAYLEALKLDPDSIDAFNGYGRLLVHQGRHKEALEQYANALARDSTNPVARSRLGFALCLLGRVDEAAQVYREWLELEPDNATAKHYLAACSQQDIPQRASEAYVVATFDGFAQSFDAKLEALNYRAPSLVGAALEKQLGEAKAALDVLDAGCGTGWCKPFLRPYARKLVGVDLSTGMLEKAKLRGGYDDLFRGELTAFIQAHPASFDVIVTSDTLCYFGDLNAVCAAAFQALRPGGQLFFTVEALKDNVDGVKLHPFGRYSHSRAHLSEALASAGFAPPLIEEDVLRNEAAVPVDGFIVSAKRT